MDWKQEHKIIKYLMDIANNIEGIEDNLGHIDKVSSHVRSAKLEIIQIIELFKKHYEPKNDTQEPDKELDKEPDKELDKNQIKN